jgi:hypothetical protein
VDRWVVSDRVRRQIAQAPLARAYNLPEADNWLQQTGPFIRAIPADACGTVLVRKVAEIHIIAG